MKIKMPVTLTASDAESRIIAGRIVQWNKEGSTSAGRTKFLPNSIEFSNDTKLVLEHQITSPIGKLIEWSQDETGVTASFKIARTTAGNDALEEAATGLRSDFSVGVQVNDWSNEDGVMAIKASELVEVSLVTSGAIPGAEVQKVAAVETEEETKVSEETQEITQQTEGEQVSDTTVQEAPAVEAVEAAHVSPTVQASAPVMYTKPVLSNADLLSHLVKAARGNAQSSQILTASLEESIIADNPGVIPVAQMRNVISLIAEGRPFINSIRREALQGFGMSFKKPRWATYPTVDVHTEFAAPASSPATITTFDVDVVSRMGGDAVSLELIDRSDPSFLTQLVEKFAEAYAKNTDTDALTAFIANAQDGTDATAYGSILKAMKLVYKNTGLQPDRLLVSPSNWQNLMAVVDGNDRPLFAPIGATNSVGSLTPFAGSILGLSVVVDRNANDETAGGYVYASNGATYYEAAGSPATVQATKVSNASVEIAVKGYDALALDYEFTVDATTTNLAVAAINTVND